MRTNKTGQKEPLLCPPPVKDHNENMGGVDIFDQYISFYNISWKSRRWWMNIFYYLVESVIVNAFICYQNECSERKKKPMSHLDFRSTLANELIGTHSSRQRRTSSIAPVANLLKKSGRSQNSSTTMRRADVGVHLPVKDTIRRCANCSSKAKLVRSTTICKECNVALCIKCFEPLHGFQLQ
ncbi:hypothetical protein JTB14_004696 [Gonioctena quinquepunctata]|nr:hypothetical protein JTB14_004696 [Gonioctena quinquepunctata]